MNKVVRVMKKVTDNLVVAIPVCMVFALVFGSYFSPSFLKTLIMPLTFLMVYPMMINLKISKIFNVSDMRVQIVAQIINFGIIPFLALFIGKLFFSQNHFAALGLLLAALLPTSGMTISWTGFARGNLEAAIKMTIFGLILGSLATPFYLKWLMGTVVDIAFMAILKQIILIVFVPMLLGYVTQRLLLKNFGHQFFSQRCAPLFSQISMLGVLGIVFVAIALKAQSILAHPYELLFLLMPLGVLYFMNFFLSTIVGKLFFNRGNGIALVYGTVMRNLSIALAIAINSFGSHGAEIALIISAAYIIQVQTAAWYVRYTDYIFNK